jgi:dolichyl-phosphate-mannose-protein mannosyltransferase
MAAVAVLLTAASTRYGYHRDELYFRMLKPAWGYVDQPPLTPLVARLFSQLADAVWAVRIPATAATVVSIYVLVLITRELGGSRRAQALCAWGYGFASLPLIMGHALLTSTLDFPVWPAYNDGPPPTHSTTEVFVGGQLDDASSLFSRCRTVGSLDDRVDVDNEEQDEPIAVCTGPVGGWRAAWPRLQHFG